VTNSNNYKIQVSKIKNSQKVRNYPIFLFQPGPVSLSRLLLIILIFCYQMAFSPLKEQKYLIFSQPCLKPPIDDSLSFDKVMSPSPSRSIDKKSFRSMTQSKHIFFLNKSLFSQIKDWKTRRFYAFKLY